jgi:adhesin transport system outer membrane protein
LIKISILLTFILINILNATTIYDTINDAIKNSYKIKTQEIEIKIKQEYIKKAEANNMPTVDLNLYHKIEKTEFEKLDTVTANSTNYAITLKQNLYNGLYDKNSIEIAKKDLEIEIIELEKITQELIYDAIIAHIQLLNSKNILLITQDTLKKYESLLCIADKKSLYGDKIDQLEVSLRVEETKMRELNLLKDYDLKVANYQKVIGEKAKNLNYNIKFKNYLVKKLSQLNLRKNNSDILQQALQIEKSYYLIEQSNSKFLPTLNLELTAYKTEPLVETKVITDNQYSAQLVVSYNLYNGKRDTIDKEINKLKSLKLITQKHDLIDDISNRYLENYKKFKYSKKSESIINRYIKKTEKKYYTYQKLFQMSSKKTILDMITAISTLANAKENKFQNISDKIISYINLLLLQSKLSKRTLK